MKFADLRIAACQNLLQTYVELGTAAGARPVEETAGFRAYASLTVHPICNFAIDLDLSPHAARQLAEIATEKPSFCVYRSPSDKPEHIDEVLERAGFERAYSLTMMIADGQIRNESIGLQRVNDPGERVEVARFMTDQFFSRQNEAFRRVVSDATASADSLSLYQAWSGRQRVACVMLSEGEVLGLYNLCVHPTFRGIGWGISTVQSVLSLAAKTKRHVTLQCEPRLQSWYEHLGFEVIGAIDVFDLAERRKRDILL